MPAISVKNLTKRFGTVCAVSILSKDFCFDTKTGAFG